MLCYNCYNYVVILINMLCYDWTVLLFEMKQCLTLTSSH